MEFFVMWIDASKVRCFRLREKGKIRHGVWIMTSGFKGVFIHGDRDEIQSPEYSVEFLESSLGALVYEVNPYQVLADLFSWPEGFARAQRFIEDNCTSPRKADGRTQLASDLLEIYSKHRSGYISVTTSIDGSSVTVMVGEST